MAAHTQTIHWRWIDIVELGQPDTIKHSTDAQQGCGLLFFLAALLESSDG